MSPVKTARVRLGVHALVVGLIAAALAGISATGVRTSRFLSVEYANGDRELSNVQL